MVRIKTIQKHVYAFVPLLMCSMALIVAPLSILPNGITLQQAFAKKTLDDFMQEQKKSPKWAAIVVDANEGKILYEKSAESKRYPASLTKMMTLYLLFEALERKKVSMSSSMYASKHAAAQPQTNVSLKKGSRITVNDAIAALIIRSANDVAVVVAEHLGGSVSGFARRMNAKAKELGMENTNFVNPHGLPDNRQVSTAMDMAKLSIALKRDFPQYYHHFKKTSFRFNGKTYNSHNRVLGRYPGVDGLKTGYIRASGFNLATSMNRGSTRLVGVIMGGATGAARDQEMINMLDRTLVAMRDQKEKAGTQYASLTVPTEPRKQLNDSAPYLSGKNWAVQVGAFPTVDQAKRAAAAARDIVPEPLAKAQLDISQVIKDNQVFNRSRMLYLSAEQARSVCDQLSLARKQCMVIRMEN